MPEPPLDRCAYGVCCGVDCPGGHVGRGRPGHLGRGRVALVPAAAPGRAHHGRRRAQAGARNPKPKTLNPLLRDDSWCVRRLLPLSEALPGALNAPQIQGYNQDLWLRNAPKGAPVWTP